MCAGAAPTRLRTELSGDLTRGGGDRLIENRERIAHGAVAGLGQQGESIVIGFNVFAADQIAQLADDVVELDGAKTEVLAARANGLRNVFRLRGRQHEDDVVRRFLQRLEQSIESGVGDLVGFVENVNLEAVARRAVARGLAQFANFVDAAIGGRVDLDHINRIAGANFGAGFADAAGLATGLSATMLKRPAVQAPRQNARYRGLSNAAMSAEDVAVGGAPLQRARSAGCG
jgi:hypothetical protein